MIEIMTWALTAFSIVGTMLNIYKKKTCFIIWSFTNFCWMLYDFSIGAYAQSALMGVYFFLAIYGIVKWSKNDGD